MSARPDIDMEVRAHADHHASLRLWLRLLSCTTRIEDTIRQRLREQFDITLPRFLQIVQHRGKSAGAIRVSHIAIKASVKTADYDPVRLTSLDVDPAWWVTLTSALADLEWTLYDYEADDSRKIVPAPDLEIGWFACASYF